MDGKVDRITYKDAGVDVNKADKLVKILENANTSVVA